MYRYPQFVFRQTKRFGQKYPGKAYGVVLEVVAKAEVAQHFKKRVVTCGIADIV